MTLELLTTSLIVGSILINVVVLLYYSAVLYDSSPEKSQKISYTKYLQVLQIDLVPGENTVLKFDGERRRHFLRLRTILLLFLLIAIAGIAIRMVATYA